MADEKSFALPVDAAGRIDFADFAHGRVEKGDVSDAHGFHAAKCAKSPASVIVGAGIAWAVILRVENHVGEAAVRLVHADDVAAGRDNRFRGLLFVFGSGVGSRFLRRFLR